MHPRSLKQGIFFYILFFTHPVLAQYTVSGTVYDSTRLYGVTGVVVKSTGGTSALTDSIGGYHIPVFEGDSIYFYYMNKPTVKFPVHSIINYNQFDISLRVRVYEKYRPLKEIFIYSKTHKQDSAENRLDYAKGFNFRKPGIRSSTTEGTPPGLDIDELIGMFQFRKNKHALAFQKRLIEQEQESYINYRFSTTLIHRITGLSGDTLTRYKKQYRPSYAFVATSNELEFYSYILNSYYAFRKQERL